MLNNYHACIANRDMSAKRERHLLQPGECTLHARSCGSGTSIFLLLQKTNVILITGSKSCVYTNPIYLDKYHGGTKKLSIANQNKPLYLSESNYRKLEGLYMNHQVVREVIRQRQNDDKLARLNWY